MKDKECLMCCEEFFEEKLTKIQGKYICKDCLKGHPTKEIMEKIRFMEEREENEN